MTKMKTMLEDSLHSQSKMDSLIDTSLIGDPIKEADLQTLE